MARCGGCCLVAAAWLCFGGSAQAQTNPLAAISGRVADPSGAPLGGVKVSVSSPALQGVRGSETTAAGDFLIPFLPPGEYEIAFRRDGFHAERDLLDASAWYDERKLRKLACTRREVRALSADASEERSSPAAGSRLRAFEMFGSGSSRTATSTPPPPPFRRSPAG